MPAMCAQFEWWPVPFTAKSVVHVDVYDPLTGEPRDARDLAARETYTLAPTMAAVMMGSPR
jgi:hypothetical protein